MKHCRSVMVMTYRGPDLRVLDTRVFTKPTREWQPREHVLAELRVAAALSKARR
jgi:hypothetical protein